MFWFLSGLCVLAVAAFVLAPLVSSPNGAGGLPRRGRLAVVVVTCLFVFAGAGAVYLYAGAPGVPDQPYAARVAAAKAAPLEELRPADVLLRLTAEAKASPDDPEAWTRLGRAYLVIGDPGAAEAFARALEVGGETAGRLQDLAAALMQRDPPEPGRAYLLLTRATELAPGSWRIRLMKGFAAWRAGDAEAAVQAWETAAGLLPYHDPRAATLRAEAETLKNGGVPFQEGAAALGGP